MRIAPAAAGKGTDYDHRKETKVNRQKPENKKDAEKALEGVYAAEYEAEGVLRELDKNGCRCLNGSRREDIIARRMKKNKGIPSLEAMLLS